MLKHALCLITFLTGCTTPLSSGPVLEVPFLAQAKGHCGDTALQMVLSFYGWAGDEQELARTIHVPVLGGTIPDLLVEAAQKEGFAAEIKAGTTTTLHDLLDQGIPPIVLFGPKEGGDIGHFVVVTAFDPKRNRICFHSGSKMNRRLSTKKFLDKWARARHTMVIIQPVQTHPNVQH